MGPTSVHPRPQVLRGNLDLQRRHAAPGTRGRRCQICPARRTPGLHGDAPGGGGSREADSKVTREASFGTELTLSPACRPFSSRHRPDATAVAIPIADLRAFGVARPAQGPRSSSCLARFRPQNPASVVSPHPLSRRYQTLGRLSHFSILENAIAQSFTRYGAGRRK